MQEAYELLKELALDCDSNAKTALRINECDKQCGCIDIICSNFGAETDQMEMFLSAAHLADNFDVMPKTDGNLIITFSFICICRLLHIVCLSKKRPEAFFLTHRCDIYDFLHPLLLLAFM